MLNEVSPVSGDLTPGLAIAEIQHSKLYAQLVFFTAAFAHMVYWVYTGKMSCVKEASIHCATNLGLSTESAPFQAMPAFWNIWKAKKVRSGLPAPCPLNIQHSQGRL